MCPDSIFEWSKFKLPRVRESRIDEINDSVDSDNNNDLESKVNRYTNNFKSNYSKFDEIVTAERKKNKQLEQPSLKRNYLSLN